MTSPIPTTDPLFPAHWLPLAETVCGRWYAEFPETDARYGERGRAYCAHDTAYLIAWLADELDLGLEGSYARGVAWLASVLEARDFPMESFRRSLTLVGEALAAERPEDAARIAALTEAARATW